VNADLVREADALVESLALSVAQMRRRFPADDYAGRIYFCEACLSFDACAAPSDELPDDYPCPTCHGPQYEAPRT
jgi:hypothetical protein